MTVSDVREGILAFLQGEISCPDTEVSDETDLFDDGLLDSLKVLRLVLHLETTYGITFSPDDLSTAAFARLPSLSSLVAERIDQRP